MSGEQNITFISMTQSIKLLHLARAGLGLLESGGKRFYLRRFVCFN